MEELFLNTLRKWWGYTSFRPRQLDVMKSVYSGQDTLALMPTGAGKSLLYQVPALSMDGVCIVVTPLIALMKDQVDRLRSMGISAAAIHSGQTMRQIDLTLDNCAWGDMKFLYVAPERISGDTFRTRFRTMKVSMIAVDEAHCISQWGYDFRPAYLRIAELRDIMPDIPILALTASATPAVADDIMRHLKMREGVVVRTSFARSNLSYVVRNVEDKQQQLLRVVSNVMGSGIVYVRTREATAHVAQLLVDGGCKAEFYHGGMGHVERSMRQDRWRKGECRVVVATNAFGMGIDKADVRFVVHYDVCDSPEAYYQEAGRAGRDGRMSYAVLLAAPDDASRSLKRFQVEFPEMDKIKECYESLFNYLQVGIGDGKYATFSFNIFEFAAKAKIYSTTAFNAIKILQQNGYMTLTDEMENPPRILFVVNRDDLYKIRVEREELDHVIRTVLRLYNGLFNDRFVPIDESEIAQMSGYTPERVHEMLKRLWELHIIKYIPGNRSPLLMLNEERLPMQDVYISPESYKIRKEMASERLQAMNSYSTNTTRCRSNMLQEYFGEQQTSPCGVCDICIEARKSGRTIEGADQTISQSIKNMLREQPKTVKDIVARFGGEPDKIIEAIEVMVADGEISIDSGGKMRIKE